MNNAKTAGTQDMPQIPTKKIYHTSYQIKNCRAPDEDGITKEMIELEGTATLQSTKVLLNECRADQE